MPNPTGMTNISVVLPSFKIVDMRNDLINLPWSSNKNLKWGKRQVSIINKSIVHQALADADAKAINNYHISPNNHISAKGCPHICYHWAIERNGRVIQCNDITDVTWHCAGQNINSIGILVCGDFTGPDHKAKEPTIIQLEMLKQLLYYIKDQWKIRDVYGHCDFGKPVCPGNTIMNFLSSYES